MKKDSGDTVTVYCWFTDKATLRPLHLWNACYLSLFSCGWQEGKSPFSWPMDPHKLKHQLLEPLQMPKIQMISSKKSSPAITKTGSSDQVGAPYLHHSVDCEFLMIQSLVFQNRVPPRWVSFLLRTVHVNFRCTTMRSQDSATIPQTYVCPRERTNPRNR